MSELDAVIKVDNEEENKTPDKKQIEAEEKEVMLRTDVDVIEQGPEKKDGDGPVTAALSGPVTEEGREVKPKFIPIGAIKMPGFFTRNSDKDKTKVFLVTISYSFYILVQYLSLEVNQPFYKFDSFIMSC